MNAASVMIGNGMGKCGLKPMVKNLRRTSKLLDKQRLELWRTLRNGPEAAAKIVAKMDPAEALFSGTMMAKQE